eukprot:scaffold2946_cov294-Pinguiococcus_pyrenoidosus.AAC.1
MASEIASSIDELRRELRERGKSDGGVNSYVAVANAVVLEVMLSSEGDITERIMKCAESQGWNNPRNVATTLLSCTGFQEMMVSCISSRRPGMFGDTEAY